MSAIPRLLNPLTDPNGYLAAAGAVFAAAVMVTNAVNHHGIIDPPVIVGAVAAVGALFARQQVTPVKDPRDGNGQPLVPKAAAPAPAPPVQPAQPQP